MLIGGNIRSFKTQKNEDRTVNAEDADTKETVSV